MKIFKLRYKFFYLITTPERVAAYRRRKLSLESLAAAFLGLRLHADDDLLLKKFGDSVM
jgi:hypothetical protein